MEVTCEKAMNLRYGENPHQQAALYGSFLDHFEQLQSLVQNFRRNPLGQSEVLWWLVGIPNNRRLMCSTKMAGRIPRAADRNKCRQTVCLSAKHGKRSQLMRHDRAYRWRLNRAYAAPAGLHVVLSLIMFHLNTLHGADDGHFMCLLREPRHGFAKLDSIGSCRNRFEAKGQIFVPRLFGIK